LVISQESNQFSFSEEAINSYETVGGTPFLDNGYTVFGEVTEGLNIVDEICSSPTKTGDKPLEPITIISMSIKK
jgi:peptidyl-prolyl cis-trans isomerase B (cyclophilin B)